MSVITLFWLLISLPLAWAQAKPRPIELFLSPDEAKKIVQEEKPCVGANSARICRGFPWPPRSNEGVVGSKDLGIIALRRAAPPESELAKLANGVLGTQRDQVYISLFLSSPGMEKAINHASYTGYLVLLLDEEGKKVAAYYTPVLALQQFAKVQAEQWRLSLVDKVGWETPPEFVPFFQFQTF